MTGPAEGNFRRLCDQAWQGMGEIPGVTLGVVHGGGEFIACRGIADVATGRPVTEATQFQIGSITKTFVALAVLRLAEAGRLDLDEVVASGATVRQLLLHTGGLGDCGGDFGEGDDALARLVESLAGQPQFSSMWSYSNAGYCLLGRVIERVTQQTFESAMQELVLEPLGLSASFVRSQAMPEGDFSSGNVSGQLWSLGRAMNPAGGLLCDIRNVLKYARCQMEGGLPMGLHAPQIASTGLWQMGFGWNVMDFDGVRMIGHGGTTIGQVALLRIVPERGFAVAMLANSHAAGRLCMETADSAIALFLGLTVPKPREIAVPADLLESYAGRYGAYEVRADGPLWLTVPGEEPARLAFHTAEGFYVAEGPMEGATGEFLRGGMRFAGRVALRVSGTATSP